METVEVTSKRYICRHIHTAGNRCGSPALTGEEFCYYHHATRRPARRPADDYIFPDSTFDLPSFEDRASVQVAIVTVARRIALNQIDLKRARLLLYALRIASINLPYESHATEPAEVTQVEAIQLDPLHGPLAPVAEVPPPTEGGKGFAQRLLEELRSRPCSRCKAIEEAEVPPAEDPAVPAAEEPATIILPEIQAVAHTSFLKAHTRAARPHQQIKLTAESRPLKAVSKNTRFKIAARRQPSTNKAMQRQPRTDRQQASLR